MNATLRNYIVAFRVAELQLCLQELGLSKKGLKAELQARLFAYFGEASSLAGRGTAPPREQHRLDSAARMITRVYCRMKGLPSPAELQREDIPTAGNGAVPGAAVGGFGSPNALEGAAAVARGPPLSPSLGSGGGGGRHNTQIRCICGSNTDRGTMIQCEDEACGVWQHCDCLGVPPGDLPEHWLCELCRLARADPFWRRMGPPLMPAQKLAPVQPHRAFGDGLKYQEDIPQLADRHFTLAHAHLDPVRRSAATHQLQVACLMLGDPVPFRVHWPRMADLRINSMQYRPYGRSAASKLGVNARDEPASVGVMCSQGRNRVSLAAVDSRTFCVLMQLARRRSLEEVKALMHAPETAAAALQRVRKQTGGKGDDGDSSDDDAVQIGRTVLSLRCPLTGSRISTPARFAPVGGITAFDLDAFLDLAARSRKWQCPHSMRALPVQQLMLDAYLARILPRLRNLPDIMEVEVSPSGDWRLPGSEGRWHSITEDAADALASPGIRIKADPEQAGGAAGGDSDSEELSEGEELRRAAAAATACTARARAAPEVIVLDSDSDDGSGSTLTASAAAQQEQMRRHRTAAGFSVPPPQPPPGAAPALACSFAASHSAPAVAASQLRHTAAPFIPGGQHSTCDRGQSRTSYTGPYPGSVPGSGGGASSSGNADAGGGVVRGRGLTIRLPQRISALHVSGAPSPAAQAPRASWVRGASAPASAAAPSQPSSSAAAAPSQWYSPLNGGTEPARWAPPYGAAAGAPVTAPGYHGGLPSNASPRLRQTYALSTAQSPAAELSSAPGHNAQPWTSYGQQGQPYGRPGPPPQPYSRPPPYMAQQPPGPPLTPYPFPHAAAAAAGSAAQACSRPQQAQNGAPQSTLPGAHGVGWDGALAPAPSAALPAASAQPQAPPAPLQAGPPTYDGLSWQLRHEQEEEERDLAEEYRDWLDDISLPHENDAGGAHQGAVDGTGKSRTSEVIELDSD